MMDDKGLVSVLMPCCGQLEYTRMRVPRLLRHSRAPFEVLFIEAGSLDGTREFLEGVATAAAVRVEVFKSNQESNFVALVEEALAKARGSFVAWVNNDVLVSELWLQQLTALATANDKIGVVAPMANIASEQQRVANVPYHLARPKRQPKSERAETLLDTQEVDRFAQEFREANIHQWKEVDRVGGFCWLAKKEVLSKVAVLEKGTGEGVFDERKFAFQVRQAGFHLACSKDLFVHHLGRYRASQE